MTVRQSLDHVLHAAIPHVACREASLTVLQPGQADHPLPRHPPLFDPGSHNRWELLVCCDGEMTIVGSQRIKRLKAGDAVVIAPGAWHYETYSHVGRSYAALWLMMSPARSFCVCSYYRRRKFAFRGWDADAWAGAPADPVAELARELVKRQPHWREKSRAGLVDLLIDLYRSTAQRRRSPIKPAEDPVSRVRHILELRFREALQIDVLAAEVGLSPNYLSHKFKATYGVAFKTYLREIRLHHAKLLLREGRPVKAVAHECGFNSVSYFIMVFKAHSRRTPADYARRPR